MYRVILAAVLLGLIYPSFAAFALSLFVSSANAASYTVSLIADGGTAIPSGTGNFHFLTRPSLDGNVVVFKGGQQADVITQNGVYSMEIGGNLQKVVDFNTSIPSAGGNIRGFGGCCSISGNTVAFGASSTTSVSGVYTVSLDTGTINTVADSNTPIPDGTGNFAPYIAGWLPSIDANTVAFQGIGYSPRQNGVYSNVGGSLGVIADSSNGLGGVSAPELDNGNVVFRGGGGVYTNLGGSLRLVADTNTAIPGGAENFSDFDRAVIDGDMIAFVGNTTGDSSGIEGVYLESGGILSAVVDDMTLIPEGAGFFTNFSPLINHISLDDGNIAFVAEGSSGQMGIYLFSDETLSRIVDANMNFAAGKSVETFWLSPEGLSGTSIAFRITFTDKSTGVYLAQTVISIPATIEIEPRKNGQIKNPTGKGDVKVAILTDASFDAMTVDGSTLAFGPNGAGLKRFRTTDVDNDGDLDFLAFFKKADTGIQCGDTEATLTGQTNAAESFGGTDSIVTAGKECR